MNTEECIETLEKVVEQLKKNNFRNKYVNKWYEVNKKQDASIKEISYLYIETAEYDKEFRVYNVYGRLIKYTFRSDCNHVNKEYNFCSGFHCMFPAREYNKLREVSEEEATKYYDSWQKEFVE